MSRIQNILDKAERDGGVRRMRPVVDTTAAAALALDAPAAPPAPSVDDAIVAAGVVPAMGAPIPAAMPTAVPTMVAVPAISGAALPTAAPAVVTARSVR